MEKVIEFLKENNIKYTEQRNGKSYEFETEQFNCLVGIDIGRPLSYVVKGNKKSNTIVRFYSGHIQTQEEVIDKIKEHAIKEGAE